MPTPDTFGDLIEDNTAFCGYLNEKNISDTLWKTTCERTTFNNFYANLSAYEECKSPCKETIYSVSLSQNVWPGTLYVDDFYQQFIANRSTLKAYRMLNSEMKSNSTTTQRKVKLIRENFVKLTIYFSTWRVQKTRQEPSYGLADLLSDVGGTLGLWAGFSVITVLEFFRLGSTIIYNVVKEKSI